MAESLTFIQEPLAKAIKTILFLSIYTSPIITTVAFANIEAVLPTITTSASQENETSYSVKNSKSSSKLNLSLKETPQSITVITQQQIEDQNLKDIDAVLEQMPGVSKIQFGSKGIAYTTYYSRGFPINNYQRDGIPTSSASFGGSDYVGLEDTAIYERVEVIRGATGLTNGSGNPSASLNYVRKRPTYEKQGSINVQAGSWDNYRSQVDVSAPLNNSGSIRGRAIAAYEQGNTWQDRANYNHVLFYTALDFDLSERTQITTALNLVRKNANQLTVHGFPRLSSDKPAVPVHFGRKDNAAANWTYSDTDKLNLFAGIEHQFNSDWKAILNYSYTKVKTDRVYGVAGSSGIFYTSESTGVIWNDPITAYPGEMTVVGGRFKATPDVHSLDAYLNGQLHLFGKEHEIAVGFNGYQSEASDPNFYRFTIKTPINGWDGSTAMQPVFNITGNTKTNEKSLGIFASSKWQILDPLSVLIGGRVTRWERDTHTLTYATHKTVSVKQKENNQFTPYIGILFDINDQITAYTSYTSIFSPTSSRDKYDQYLNAQNGNSYELGLKGSFFDHSLNSSIALFKTKVDDYPMVDYKADGTTEKTSDGSNAYVGVNSVKMQGVELELSGELRPNWQINAGYTYTDTKAIDKKGVDLLTTLPEHTFKLFTSYKFAEKYMIGGGVNWQSKIFNATATPQVKAATMQDNYVLVNLMMRYEVDNKTSIGLNFNNLFDKTYFVNASGSSYGAPRNVTASLTYKF
ncbi:TonB-dependent siderophore receptor [Acinetobacter sp. ANC 4558]|uniref:TonB-dependent siderophore receptor n=1 Tax=Acinetobacter sp. ANC 4558 TaxID=1977876 RepID=UPI00148A62E9|nr:TonB-dependent siderophore receptor [Acinetobacter sp. ANC 4558]